LRQRSHAAFRFDDEGAGLKQSAMEVFEQQVFNEAGKIAHVRVYFDENCLQ
jgi:hypothetical protein